MLGDWWGAIAGCHGVSFLGAIVGVPLNGRQIVGALSGCHGGVLWLLLLGGVSLLSAMVIWHGGVAWWGGRDGALYNSWWGAC